MSARGAGGVPSRDGGLPITVTPRWWGRRRGRSVTVTVTPSQAIRFVSVRIKSPLWGEMEKLDPAPSSPEGVVFYHFFMTYQLEHEQAEPTRVAGPFSASSSHREPLTEHQGPVRGAEKLRNRLREGRREGSWGCSIVPNPKHSGTLLAHPHPQGKGHSWNRPMGCLGCPAAQLGWDHLSGVLLWSCSGPSPVRGPKVLLVPGGVGTVCSWSADLHADTSCLWTHKNTSTQHNKYGLPQPPFFHPAKE